MSTKTSMRLIAALFTIAQTGNDPKHSQQEYEPTYYTIIYLLDGKSLDDKNFLTNDACKTMNIQDADIMGTEKGPTNESSYIIILFKTEFLDQETLTDSRRGCLGKD